MEKLFKITTLLLVVAIVFIWTLNSHAVEVEGLYRVEIPVTDQKPATRWAAALQGFKEVLIRKSGSQEVLSADEVKQAFRKVTAYIQRFEYAAADNKQAEFPFKLQLDFEPRLVDELIQASGMPIWGSNRPITILWLATEENFQRDIIRESAEEDSLSELIRENAQRRGIPVILPLMDLEDEMNVTISDIWGRFNSTLITASQRYAADSIVTGRVQQIGEAWQAKLSYINQDDERVLEFSQQTRELLVETLADRLAELLCQKYCVVEMAESHLIKIQVSGVGSFASFKKLETYLQGLSSIRKVEVDKIAGSSVRFDVALLGDLQSVKDGIELGNRLIVESEPKEDIFAKPLLDANQDINPDAVAMPSTDFNKGLNDEGFQTANLLDESAGQQPVEPPVILFYRWTE